MIIGEIEDLGMKILVPPTKANFEDTAKLR